MARAGGTSDGGTSDGGAGGSRDNAGALNTDVATQDCICAPRSAPLCAPGEIQPHGVLLVVGATDRRVVQASANLPDIFGVAPSDVLGRLAPSLFGAEHWASIQALLHHPVPGGALPVARLPAALSLPDMMVRPARSPDGRLCLELERIELRPDGKVAADRASAAHRAEWAIGVLRQADNVPDLCAAAAREIRELTRYERALVYRFRPDGDGEVIAEDHAPDVAPLLGQHYPADDIPAEARLLYLRQHLRLIPDMQYRPVPMLYATGGGAPVDMTHCLLRSVPPIHRSYMLRMGVQGTLVMSLARADGRLWGLMLCHAMSRRALPSDVRVTLDAIGQEICTALETLPMEAAPRRAWPRHASRAALAPAPVMPVPGRARRSAQYAQWPGTQ